MRHIRAADQLALKSKAGANIVHISAMEIVHIVNQTTNRRRQRAVAGGIGTAPSLISAHPRP
eukprot:1565877-Pleurochrysis_carterae.AAC.1